MAGMDNEIPRPQYTSSIVVVPSTCPSGFSEGFVASPNVSASPSGPEDGASFSRDSVREDLAPMVSIKAYDFRHRSSNRQRTTHDRPGARARDQVEAASEIKCRLFAYPGKLIRQAGEKRRHVDAAHTAAIEAENSIWPRRLLIFLTIAHDYSLD